MNHESARPPRRETPPSAAEMSARLSPEQVLHLQVGYRRLAARVIHQAFRDLENPSASPEHRRSARTFLTGSQVLVYWSELAETDIAVVVAQARACLLCPETVPSASDWERSSGLPEPSPGTRKLDRQA